MALATSSRISSVKKNKKLSKVPRTQAVAYANMTFVDDKVNLLRRSKVPLVVDARKRIIWVCGVRMSEDFKVTPRTEKCLRLAIFSLRA